MTDDAIEIKREFVDSLTPEKIIETFGFRRRSFCPFPTSTDSKIFIDYILGLKINDRVEIIKEYSPAELDASYTSEREFNKCIGKKCTVEQFDGERILVRLPNDGGGYWVYSTMIRKVENEKEKQK